MVIFIGQPVLVVLRISRVGAHELSRGRGQHDPREAAVLVGVQGPRGDTGQAGAVLQTVWMDEGGSSRGLLHCCCCWVVSGVGSRPVGLQLRIMHELGGDVCLAGVSQGVLHGPLQLHASVLKPVSDLRCRKKRKVSWGKVYTKEYCDKIMQFIIFLGNKDI